MKDKDLLNLLENMQAPIAANPRHKLELRQKLLNSPNFNNNGFKIFWPKFVAVGLLIITIIAGSAIYSYKFSSRAQAEQILNNALQAVQSLPADQQQQLSAGLNQDLLEALQESRQGKDLRFAGILDVKNYPALSSYETLRVIEYTNSQGQTVALGVNNQDLPVFKKVLDPGQTLSDLLTVDNGDLKIAGIKNNYTNSDLGVSLKYPFEYGNATVTARQPMGNLCADAKGIIWQGSFSNSDLVEFQALSSDYSPCPGSTEKFNYNSFTAQDGYLTFTNTNTGSHSDPVLIAGEVSDNGEGTHYYIVKDNYFGPADGSLPMAVLNPNNSRVGLVVFYLNHASDRDGSTKPEVTSYKLGLSVLHDFLVNLKINDAVDNPSSTPADDNSVDQAPQQDQ